MKVAGLGRDMVIARCFGASEETDAFYLVFPIVSALGLGLYAAVPNVFVPVFQRETRAGMAQSIAGWLGLTLLTAMLLLAVLATCAADASAVFLLGESRGADAVSILRTMAWALPWFSVTAIVAARARAVGRLLVVRSVSAALPVATLVFVAAWHEAQGIEAAALGVVVGAATQAVVCLVWAHRCGLGFSFHRVDSRALMRAILSLMCLVGLGSTGGVVGVWAERHVAAWLPAGDVTSVGYAQRVGMVPVGLLTGSIVAITLSKLPRLWAGSRLEDVLEIVGAATRTSVFVVLAFAVPVAAAGGLVFEVLFANGNVNAPAPEALSTFFLLWMPFLIATAVRSVVVTALLARGAVRAITWIGLLRVASVTLIVAPVTSLLGSVGFVVGLGLVEFLVTAVTLRWLCRAMRAPMFATLRPLFSLLALGLLALVPSYVLTASCEALRLEGLTVSIISACLALATFVGLCAVTKVMVTRTSGDGPGTQASMMPMVRRLRRIRKRR